MGYDNVCYLVLGFLLALLIAQKGINAACRDFLYKASLLKEYWKFVIPFSILGISSYLCIFSFVPSRHLSDAVNVLNFALASIFAIFVGYFSFLQVLENRFDKFKNAGRDFLKRRQYLRAIQCYEKAHQISPKDADVLGDLLEVYLIISKNEKFQKLLPTYEKNIIEDRERIIYRYLIVVELLLRQYLKDACEKLKECVEFIRSRPTSPFPLLWDFGDLKNSEVFKRLSGESKKIFENFLAYLSDKLDVEKKKRFEGNDFLLNEDKISLKASPPAVAQGN